jgi:hypothetical protein
LILCTSELAHGEFTLTNNLELALAVIINYFESNSLRYFKLIEDFNSFLKIGVEIILHDLSLTNLGPC